MFLDSIDVFADGLATSQCRSNLDVHTVHKPKRYEAFTRICLLLRGVVSLQVRNLGK